MRELVAAVACVLAVSGCFSASNDGVGGSGGSAGSAGPQQTAGSAGSAQSAGSGGDAGAQQAGSAGIGGEAGSAGTAGAAQVCLPETPTSCLCTNPVRLSSKRCAPDGSGYGECDCSTGGGGGVSGAAGAAGSAGQSGSAGAAGEAGSGGATSCPAPAPYQDQTCLEYAGGTYTCSSGECVPCSMFAHDCDGDPSNGCETPVGDSTCYDCLHGCSPGHVCELVQVAENTIRYSCSL